MEQEVLYPSVGLRLFALKDADLQLACFRAYNNWLRDFCAAYPEKLKGSGLISLLDVGRGVAEVERARHIGMVGVTIAIHPDDEQLYADARYDPFWQAASDLDVPITLHVLTERKPKVVGKTEADLATEDIAIRRTLTAMVFGGVFERFPDLNIVSAENDIGWLPYFLERLDYLFDRRQNLSRFKLSRALPPSAYIRKSVFFTFMRDSSWVPARSLLNMDNIMWGSDFPHLDSVWPHSRDVVARVLAGVSEEERRNVVAGNVSRLYGFARATTTAHK